MEYAWGVKRRARVRGECEGEQRDYDSRSKVLA